MNGDQNSQTTVATTEASKPAETPETSQASATPATPAGGFFHTDSTPAAEASEHAELASQPLVTPSVQWTTSGDHFGSKSNTVGLLLVLLVITGVTYLMTKSIFSAGAIFVIGLLFGYLGTKKPHNLSYRIDDTGITIGQKHYPFGQFRSFTLVDEGGYTSISLMPLKRFLPVLSMLCDPQMQQQIVDALSARLPVEEHKRDLIDQVTSRFRF